MRCKVQIGPHVVAPSTHIRIPEGVGLKFGRAALALDLPDSAQPIGRETLRDMRLPRFLFFLPRDRPCSHDTSRVIHGSTTASEQYMTTKPTPPRIPADRASPRDWSGKRSQSNVNRARPQSSVRE
jgi:hypothetical protein